MIEIIEADITTLAVDVIFNAAGPALRGGGGVDGAIHRAAGPGLLRESMVQAPCPPGEARITRGHRLPARHVVHAVGPRWRDPHSELLLAQAWRSAFALAEQHACATIAAPFIGCGVFGFPQNIGRAIAVTAAEAHLAASAHARRITFTVAPLRPPAVSVPDWALPRRRLPG